METKVDILIPSKDRALQLHLLFESMNRCLKNIGKITVSFQTSTDDFLKSYQLLQHRIYNDDKFQNLRQNTTEIVFHRRNCLSDVIKVVDDLGESDYVMPLVDDDIFYRPYDFGKAECFKYLREHETVLACSLRLGDNICNSGDSHRNVTVVKEEPILKVKDKNMLIWDWPENLINTHNWVCITAVTSHIYRKKTYVEWYHRFGSENFLLIEGRAQEDLVAKVYRIPRFIVKGINFLNRLQMGILRRTIGTSGHKGIKEIFWERVHRRKPKMQKTVPVLMVAPHHSVCYSLELNNSINRGLNVAVLAELNQHYLRGSVLDYDYFAGLKFYYSILLYTEELKFVTY